jgi:hypothetical protein
MTHPPSVGLQGIWYQESFLALKACCHSCPFVHHPWQLSWASKFYAPLQSFTDVQIPCSPSSWEIPVLELGECTRPGQSICSRESSTDRVIQALPVVRQTRLHTHTHTHSHSLSLSLYLAVWRQTKDHNSPPAPSPQSCWCHQLCQTETNQWGKPWSLSGRKYTL